MMKNKNLLNLVERKSYELTRKGRHSLDSILSRFCVVSLIYANKLLNHRTTPLGRFVLPEHLPFSKPKVNWLLHVSLICLCMLTIGSGNAWGLTSTVTIGSTNYPTAKTGTTVSGTGDLASTWNVTVVANYFNGNDNGIHAGSNGQTATSIVLTSSSFSGKTITAISVTGRDANGTTNNRAVFTAKVNGSAFGSTSRFTTSSDTYTATGSVACTGNVSVEVVRPSAVTKAIYVSAVSVTFSNGGGATYTVTYALNGGTGTTPTESAKSAGAEFTLHNGTTGITPPTGKIFSKWRDQDSNDFSGGATYTMPAKNVTLTAQWIDEPSCDYDAATSLSVGDEIIIVIPASSKQMKAVNSGGEVVDYPNVCPDEELIFTVEEGYNGSDLALKTSDDKYLSWSSSTTVQLVNSVTSTNQNWTTETVGGVMLLKNKGDNRYLLYYNNTNMRLYQSASQASTVKPTIYVLNGCEPLGTINGSFTFSNVSATSVTVGVPSDYSDKNNANLEGYIFKRYSASTGGTLLETKETNSSSGTTATFNTGLVANTTYYYTIIAKHSSSSCNSAETSPRKSHAITSYTVSYANGGGSGTNPGAHSPVLSGTSVTLKANTFTAPAGKQFAGWNDGTNDYDAGDSYSVTANKTMTAQWSCITPAISSSSISNASYSIGDTPADLSVTASGGTLSYEWKQCATENGTYVTVTGGKGGNTDTYTPPTSAASDLWYQCTVTNTGSSCNTTATSGKAHIIVSAPSYRLWTAWANGNDCDGDICNTWNWTGGSYFVNYNSTNEWRISNFTIPDFEWDAVNQRQMIYNVAGKNATNTKFYDLALAVSQGSASVKKGPMPGAVGTLRMYDNSDQPNGYLGFLPNKYMIRFGTHDYVMSETSTTVWETAIQTLDAADLTNVSQFRVGVTNSSDEFVAINENCSLTNVTSMGQKSDAGDNWGSNIAAGDAGKRGKFRIWLDNASNNWNAHFVPYHRIIFKANYHDGAIGDEPADTYSVDVSVEETNSSIALASAPTAPAGYTFAGWFTDATGGTQRTGAQTISAGATADVTLYAHWTANANTAYTVKHYQQNIANDDYTEVTGDRQNLTGTTDASVTPAVKSYTGFTAPSTQTATILGDGSLVIEYQYSRNSYNLTWNLGGGTTTSAGTGIASGVSVNTTSSIKFGTSLTAPTVTKTGYGFSAWSPAKAATMPAAATTYTATWSAMNYTITYNLNSGTNPGGAPTGFTIESSEITLPTPTRAGYRFDGWYANVGLTGDVQTTIPAGSTGNKTYWAKWTAKEDTYKTALHTGASGWTTYASGVTKSGAGYTIPAPSSVAKGATSTCEDLHYHFAGWVADDYKGSPSGHIITATGTTDATGTTYWAVWEKEAAGGGGTSSITITRSTTGITATGYDSGAERTWTQSEIDFGGHYIMTNNKNTPSGASASQYIVMQKSNGTLYNTEELPGAITEVEVIQYSELACNVYCGDERLMASDNTSTGQTPSGTLITKPDDATTMTWTISASNNYRFFALKAYTSSSSGTNYITSVKVTYSTITYEDPKAVCEACVATPSISGVSLTGSAFSTTSVPVQATGAAAGTNCSITEYGFYWGTSADPSTNNTSSNNLSTGTFSATLTGPFETGTTYHYRAYATNEGDNTGYSSDATFTLHNVTFNMHDHGDAKAAQVVPEGGKVTNPGNPSATGYTFDGWWANSTFSGSAWDFSTNTVGSGDLVLHAKWTEKPKYTITLNAGNGTISDANWTNTSGSTYTRRQANGDEEITLPTPSCGCAGWVFKGWSTTSKDNAASFTPDKEDGASFVPGSNVTYYAVYRQNASGGTTYNKITSTGDLTTGDYLFVANGGYAMKNAVTSNRMEEVSGFASSEPSLTTENSAIVWTIIKFSSQVVIKNGSNYIGIDANNKICLTTTPHFFTYTYNGTNSRWEFTSAAKTDYQLAYSTAHGGAYAYFCIGTSQSTAIYLYKQGAGLTGNYYTNPTCSDYTINGVADPAAGGTVTLSAASAKTDDKVYALYTLNKDYNFVDWEISGTGSTLSSTTALITEITVGSANTTVTANFELKEWAVTWKANGETLTGGDLGDARNYFDNDETIDVLPPNPTSCESGSGASDQFMGWVAESENWSGPINDVSAKHIYKKASDFPAVTGNVTYHAVWAAIDNESSEWAKVTSVSGLHDGETVAFITYGDSYYLSNAAVTAGTTISLSSVTKTSGNINFVDAMKFTAHYNSTYDGFSFESYSASGAYLWAYDDNKGIYISTTAGSSSGASEIWYLEDFDEGNSRETGYGIGMYSHTNKKYRYLSTQGTTDWRSYVAATVGTGDPVCLLANIYHYTSGHKNYKTKCCEDPELEFGQTRYSLIREDLHGNTSGAYSTIELTYSSESTGEIRVWNQYDEDGNPDHSTKTAWQYTGANTWGTSPTTGGTAATASTHAYFAITDAENGKATFYVKNATASNGRGTYRVALHQAADATHCETVTYCWIDVTLRDKFVDAVNGNTFPNADAHGPGEPAVTTPAESTRDAAKDDDCHETTRRLVGWVKETDMESWYGAGQDRTRDLDDKKDDAELVAPGATITTSGATWYAVWGIEE